jgi:uncharacterized protein (DUF1800 family)
MKRRDLLTAITGFDQPGDPSLPQQASAVSPFANKVLPKVQQTTAGLEQYSGPFGTDLLLHLLRRTMFGAARADVNVLKGQGMVQVVDQLLAVPPAEASAPLLYATATNETTPVGSTWINATTNDNSGGRYASLKAWWLNLMLNQPISIREKMVLFWHNHFVTATGTVGDPRYTYRYLALLRNNALGNFKDLTRQISIDGAMLIYLNGYRNSASAPDENYARELQELFTIGKGPQVGPGDYTNYTEDDVRAAAKVLTGWRLLKNADGSIGPTTSTFNVNFHDSSNKTFSNRYANTVVIGSADGLAELNAMLDMIFAQPETARFICRKLYRWFVYYVIDSWTEANIIEPLAATLRSNNYNILPVLNQLLKSAHFFDAANVGCVIKNPVDLVLGLCRQYGLPFPTTDVPTQYNLWNSLVNQAATLQLSIGDPPDVSGWHAYYQEPEYYELWINSDTLPKRSAWTSRMASSGISSGSTKVIIDPIAFVKTLSDPTDPNIIVNETAQFFFPIPITPSQQVFLKGVLIPGLPDYEWTAEWTIYLADPTNPTKLAAVKSKLQSLISFMMTMPEYQLM